MGEHLKMPINKRIKLRGHNLVSSQFRARIVFSIFIATIILSLAVPDAPQQIATDKSVFIGVIILLIAIYGARLHFDKKNVVATTDIFLILACGFFFWELLLGKFALLDSFIFPSPSKVFMVFETDWEQMSKGVISSLGILTAGYILALVFAIPIGLYAGWKKRLFNIAYPVAKTLSPIPATVYLPYSIVLLPTFKASSIFLIFIGAFWPILVGAVNGVFSVDTRLINSARSLDLSDYQMIRRILLPAALPSIFSGAMIALILSFITLTVAEMVAATSGIGWYIQYYHQFANYDKVIAGMILMTVVVIVVMCFFDNVQKYFLRWHPVHGEVADSASSI